MVDESIRKDVEHLEGKARRDALQKVYESRRPPRKRPSRPKKKSCVKKEPFERSRKKTHAATKDEEEVLVHEEHVDEFPDEQLVDSTFSPVPKRYPKRYLSDTLLVHKSSQIHPVPRNQKGNQGPRDAKKTGIESPNGHEHRQLQFNLIYISDSFINISYVHAPNTVKRYSELRKTIPMFHRAPQLYCQEMAGLKTPLLPVPDEPLVALSCFFYQSCI